MDELKRSKYCGEIREEDIGQRMTLMGWVGTSRDLGGVIFIDLRDRSGIAQIVFNPEVAAQAHEAAGKVRSEFVLAVEGEIRKRPPETENLKIPTGTVELMADRLVVLSESKTPPFMIEDDEDVSEVLRLKHRYLDLRRPRMQRNLMLRHKAMQSVRRFYDAEGFIEVETPILTRSTPEGARDYLVPSRLQPGNFYALPQSPQLFKQLLMISGFDRYYQIVKCFRDEDLRKDRQPEFTQIDVETSFLGEREIQEITERMVKTLFKDVLDLDIEIPFPRLTYQEAMLRYGSDKPDVRFGLELTDLSEVYKDTSFRIFANALKEEGVVKALALKGLADLPRSELDRMQGEENLKTYYQIQTGAKGVAWTKLQKDGWQGPVAKALSDEEKEATKLKAGLEAGDLLLFAAGDSGMVNATLDLLRNHFGRKLGLVNEDEYRFLWVTDFPLLEYDAESGRYTAMHHPFTSPRQDDLDILESDPSSVRARAYDLVLNGNEIGGGSIRIHRPDVQTRVFKALGISEDEAQERFRFLMEALEYGAPPHGGIAFGFDRIMMLLTKAGTIRDVMAFPKTQRAVCGMTEAPSSVDAKQLEELWIQIRHK